jgi:hypothetical protein
VTKLGTLPYLQAGRIKCLAALGGWNKNRNIKKQSNHIPQKDRQICCDAAIV